MFKKLTWRELLFVVGIIKENPEQERQHSDSYLDDDDSTLQAWDQDDQPPTSTNVRRLPTSREKLAMDNPTPTQGFTPPRSAPPAPPQYAPHNSANIPPTGTVSVLGGRRSPDAPQEPVVTEVDAAAVVYPETYADCEAIGEHFRAERVVVVNMEATENTVSRRILDFISGIAFISEATLTTSVPRVFVLSPANVELSKNGMQRLRERGLVT